MPTPDVIVLMRRLTAGLLATSLLLLPYGASAAESAPAHARIVGYATAWDAAQDKDAGKIDTLIFAFATLQRGRVTLDPSAAERLRGLTALKAAHPALRVAISVGGWGAGGFSEAAASARGRQTLADSAAQCVVTRDADGIDVDWEYPGHNESGIGSSVQDRIHFTQLIEALRAALDKAGAAHGRTGARRYTLSIAAADGPFVSGIDIAAVTPMLDSFNLMTYDFVNSMTSHTGHHSGLANSPGAPADARSVERAVQQFLRAGVPPGKLMIGAAFYGREFGDVEEKSEGLYQRYGHYEGERPWPQLKQDYIDKNGYQRRWDSAAQAPWLWNARLRRFISYDDPQSIAAKADYVKALHLGGIMYWEQGLDPSGELLDALWQGLR